MLGEFSKLRRGGLAGLVLGLIATAGASGAWAQAFVRQGDLSGYDIVQGLRAQGYTVNAVMRNRDVFLADVMGGGGRMLRVIVDPRSGRILQRFAERPVEWRGTPDDDLAMPDGRFAPPPPVMMDRYGGEVLVIPGDRPGWRPPAGSRMARDEQGGPIIIGPNGPRDVYQVPSSRPRPKAKAKPSAVKPAIEPPAAMRPATLPAAGANSAPAASAPANSVPANSAPAMNPAEGAPAPAAPPTEAPTASAPERQPTTPETPAAAAPPQAPATPPDESAAKPAPQPSVEATPPEPQPDAAKASEPAPTTPDAAAAPAESAPAPTAAAPPAAPAGEAKSEPEKPEPATSAPTASEPASSEPQKPALEQPASAPPAPAPAASTASVKPVEKPVDKPAPKGGTGNKPVNDLPVNPLD